MVSLAPEVQMASQGMCRGLGFMGLTCCSNLKLGFLVLPEDLKKKVVLLSHDLWTPKTR